MELKEGMYVRRREGINRIVNVNKLREPEIKIALDNGFFTSRKFIQKASFNIIDLIEVGDIVNGFLVSDFDNLGGCKFIITRQPTLGGMEAYIPNEHIETVLTYEQYKRNMYEVK